MRIPTRVVWVLLSVFVGTVLATPRAQARTRKPRAAVPKLVLVGCSDRDDKRLLKKLGSVLKKNKKQKYKIVPVRGDADEAAHLAAEKKALAAVVCSTEEDGGKWRAHIGVYAVNGSVLTRHTFEASKRRSLPREIQKGLWKNIGSALEQADNVTASADDKPAPTADDANRDRAEGGKARDSGGDASEDGDGDQTVAAAPARDSLADDDDEPGQERSLDDDDDSPFAKKKVTAAKRTVVHTPSQEPPLLAHAGLRFFTRSLTYDNAALPSYDLGVVPSFDLGAIWYPLAHTRDDFVSRLGVSAQVQFAVGLTTTTAQGGVEFPTSASEFLFGVHAWHPIKKHRVTVDLGYGLESFTIGPSGTTPKPMFPDVSYGFVRIAAGGEFVVTPKVSASAQIGYRLVLDAGEIASATYYPEASAYGFDLRGQAAYRIFGPLSAVVALSWERYGHTLNARMGAPNFANSAVDQYIAVTLGAAYQLDNK